MLTLPTTRQDLSQACTAELLELFIPESSSIHRRVAVDGVRQLFPATATTAQEQQFLAAMELVRRASREKIISGPVVAGPLVNEYLRYHFLSRDTEVLVAFWLNVGRRVIAIDELAEGSIDAYVLKPREIVRMALERKAAAVLLAHNCTTGIATPVSEDVEATVRVRDALRIVDIELVDHILVGGRDMFSLKENALI